MKVRQFHVKPKFSSVQRYGIGVEYFPRYVNLTPSLHSLDVVLLSFILSGRGHHMIDDDTFTETGSSLAVTHYGQRHDIVTDSRGMNIINVYLDLQRHPLPALAPELQRILPLLIPLHPSMQHRLNRVVRLQFDNPWPGARLLFALQYELEHDGPGRNESVEMLTKLFLTFCCRHVIKAGFVAQSTDLDPKIRRIEGIRQFLDQSYAEAHTLDELAGRAKLSRSYLSRTFKVYTGKNLSDYLVERRVQAAMASLRGTDEKVMTVAMSSGFSDLAYFNRTFKRIVGMTPSEYRKR